MKSWTQGSTTTAYEWDAAGNRTKVGSRSATYDARNRQLTDGSTGFTYSPRGTLSKVDDGSGTPRTLTFDAFERKITDGGATYSHDSLDRVQTRGTTTLAYDVAGLSSDGQQGTGSAAYDPFGTETTTTGTTPAAGYQSGWTDPSSGDVNMAACWYQPGSGAFTSRDTYQLDPTPSAQANRYTYANAEPLNGTDPSGHCLGPVIVICGVAVWEGLGWGVAATVAIGGGVMVGDKYLRSQSDAWSNGYAQTNVLSNSYAGTMAGALSAQARGFSGSGAGGGNA
ncbi:RHS repeat-associated core domain-containing protein [Streptomyces sp. NPDC058545]|uniref:RHS repeat-associated core domain-containing protein n=1 Tax=Streptomyces sp. NPDC058545 TaxID=3346544 RepID=UPI003654B36D